MTQECKLEFTLVDPGEQLPEWTSIAEMALFLNRIMKPFEDTVEDVERGIRYALSTEPGRGGFVIVARDGDTKVGAIVFLRTGMQGYVPENLLLFVGVEPNRRGEGIGGKLIMRALERCEGSVKLHVEPDNPARRLYGRLGFEQKYIEMRYMRAK